MPVKISLSSGDPLAVNVDLAVVAVPEGASTKAGPLKALARALGPVVARTLKREEFTGKKDQSVEFSTNGALRASRVVVVGTGGGPVSEAAVRVFAAKAARQAQSQKATSLSLGLPAGTQTSLRAAAEGVVLGAYRFTRYFTQERAPKTALEKIALVVSEKLTKDMRTDVETGQAVGEAICVARDLINEPPNELYPESFARICAEVCREKGLKCTIFDKAALTKKNFKLLLAVGQGSVREPRVMHMVYMPAGDAPRAKERKKIVFVGKGLTFDSGGLCIKPAQGMEEMKGDMGGAANVLALMAAVATVKPDVEVHGLIGSVENMPDGNAYRPSDIFGSLDGKFVEIINTDAEGRLVLADVLAYGRELKPDLMVDNATLTGACIVALGPTVSGFYANQDDLAERMKTAAKAAGEPMWHMPLVEELRDGLKSDYADIKHTADRWGGSITAALFLREFVGQTPWIHVDIAGPSTAHRASGIYSKGGTGHGVLTFLKLIDQIAAEGAKAERVDTPAPKPELAKAATAAPSAPKAPRQAARRVGKKSAKAAPAKAEATPQTKSAPAKSAPAKSAPAKTAPAKAAPAKTKAPAKVAEAKPQAKAAPAKTKPKPVAAKPAGAKRAARRRR